MKIKIILDNRIRIEKGALPPEGIEVLRKRLTYKNPLYYAKGKYRKRYENKEITPTLSAMWEDDLGNVVIARGFLEELQRVLHANRLTFEIEDQTRRFNKPCGFDASIGVQVKGANQWPEHSKALEELGKHQFACLVGPLGSSKAMIATKLIARRQVQALVIASGKNRMYLWREKVSSFLGLSAGQVGLIGDGHWDLERNVTVAISFSLYKVLEKVEPRVGFVIIDQCDRASLNVYYKVGRFNSKYTLGLADANKRLGGLTRLMWAYLGPRVYELPERPQSIERAEKPKLRIRTTGFDSALDDYREIVSALCRDEARNRLLVMDILQVVALRSRRVLVLSERKSQLRDLLLGIEYGGIAGAIIDGGVSVRRRSETMAAFNKGEIGILLGTSRSIEAGSITALDVLVVASPVRYVNGLAQLYGKLLGSKKSGFILDYSDRPEILRASLKKRRKILKALGVVEEV